MPETIQQVQQAFTVYTVERELSSGGMATVYLAHDGKHDRKVAIKVLHAELAAVLGAERFLQEISVTANLQHPHILGLIDSGVIGDDGGELRGNPGGKRFVVLDAASDQTRIEVVVNWLTELRAKLK